MIEFFIVMGIAYSLFFLMEKAKLSKSKKQSIQAPYKLEPNPSNVGGSAVSSDVRQ